MQQESVISITSPVRYTTAISQGVGFGAETQKKQIKKHHHGDYLLEATTSNKLNAKINTAKNIPSYVKSGLGGDPNFNFYQFMQITKIPYFLGGPGLVATILAGKNLLDVKANKAAGFNAKGMALGCAMYYLMSSIAKKCVDIPVKAFRGVDLNHPYTAVIHSKSETPDGKSVKKYEQHKVFESSKFIRWDLLYNRDSKNPKEINSRYNEYAKKMGMPEDSNDTDSTVKPIIMSLIKQANAWKYTIAAFAVMLGVGLGNQKAIKEDFCTGLTKGIKQNFSKDTKTEAKHVKTLLNTKIIKPIKNSFVSLWKGTEGSKSAKYTGKFAIIGFLASVLVANVSILSSTNKKDTDFVRTEEANA